MDLVFRTRLVGAALAAATLLAACGSGDSDSSGTQPWTCAPGVTDDQIRVGILYPDTGAMAAQFANYRSGVEARLAEQNAEGGVGGRLITSIWRDDESNRGVNLQAARDLVDRGVFAVIESTAFSQDSSPWLAEQEIPVVGVADQPVWGDNENMFTYSYVTDDTDATTTLGEFISAQGGSRTALVTAASEASRLYAEGARRSLEAAGLTVVFQGRIDSMSTGNVIARIIASGADSLVASTSLDVFTGALITAAEQGHPFRTAVSPANYDVRVLQSGIRQALAGSFAQLPFTAVERDLPAHRAYVAAMATHAPEIQPATQQSAVDGWISADLFIRGLKTQQDCPTRESFMKGLRAVTDYDAGGLLAQKINFSTDQGLLDRCSDFVRVSPTGEAFEVVSPQPLCGRRLGGPPAAP